MNAPTPARPVRVILMPEGDAGQRAPAPAPATDARQPDRAAAAAADGMPVSFSPGQTLAQAVYLSGRVQPPALCSGLACCGRCRMRLDDAPPPNAADRRRFSPAELDDGWRLACRVPARPGLRAELPLKTVLLNTVLLDTVLLDTSSHGTAIAEQRPAPPADQAATDANALLLAVDLGTTSLQWEAFPAPPGDGSGAAGPPLVSGGEINPQMGAGSEVVSRLAVAASPAGRERLRAITLDRLRAIAFAAAKGRGEVTAMCLAGNPAMTCITLGLDTRGLAAAPYRLPYAGGRWEQLPSLPPLWTAPQLSPFVGGDISAGYAFLALNPHREAPAFPFLLADLGTNGEFLLALSPERACCASVALGPALEGTGLSRGGEAGAGAVYAFSVSPRGLQAHCLPDDWRGGESHPAENPAPDAGQGQGVDQGGREQAPGITGTGYISLLRTLLRLGLVNRAGALQATGGGPLTRLCPIDRLPETGEARLRLPLGLDLTATDIEELLKVKAAFSLGMRLLLAHAGLDTRDLARVHVAGALGLHVDKEALEELGFLPQGMINRVEAVGNSSLGGAALLLESEERRRALVAWAGGVSGLDLAADPRFQREFADHMRFGW
jgi:uncharacterized 2Fe-2S/4Fe-4S cluster protein (DUF4445 family)